MDIKRLTPNQATAISDCFRRVYGDSYANEIFYDLERLSEALENESLCSVGAVVDDGRILGHMAMTIFPGAHHAELGNTVVDPDARGEGIAWRIGDALTDWAKEKGFEGYLHYPTTDHHIMQQQSVKRGFETGLMLGYIPAETDGKVNESTSRLRGAATIVFQPLAPLHHEERGFLPKPFAKLIQDLAVATGVERDWIDSSTSPSMPSVSKTYVTEFLKRDLIRLEAERVGSDFVQALDQLKQAPHACKQIDFRLSDEANGRGVNIAIDLGFVFCGWLPGYRDSDVLRLQLVDHRTDLNPGVVNPVGQRLSELLGREIGV